MTDKSKDELIDEAVSLGVDVRPSWSKARLETEIVKAAQPRPQPAEQIDPGNDDRLRRFTALDQAERLGVAVGDDWTAEQIEQAVTVIQAAADVTPPAYDGDGYGNPDGAASPRG